MLASHHPNTNTHWSGRCPTVTFRGSFLGPPHYGGPIGASERQSQLQKRAALWNTRRRTLRARHSGSRKPRPHSISRRRHATETRQHACRSDRWDRSGPGIGHSLSKSTYQYKSVTETMAGRTRTDFPFKQRRCVLHGLPGPPTCNCARARPLLCTQVRPEMTISCRRRAVVTARCEPASRPH